MQFWMMQVEFEAAHIKSLLYYYQKYGRQSLAVCRNNPEKTKVYMAMAKYINGTHKTS